MNMMRSEKTRTCGEGKREGEREGGQVLTRREHSRVVEAADDRDGHQLHHPRDPEGGREGGREGGKEGRREGGRDEG